MAQPCFKHHQHWTDFPQYSYSIFNNKWVHHRLYDFKFTNQSDSSVAKFRLVPKISQKQLQYGYEASLLRKLRKQKALFFRVKSNNSIKIHYDHGTFQKGGYKWDLYGSILGKGTFQSVKVRFGAHIIGNKFQTDNRIKCEIGSTRALTWYNRSLYDSGKFKLGFMGAYCLQNWFLLKNDVLFGYEINNKTSAFLRFETYDFRKYAQNIKNWQGLFDMAQINLMSSHKQLNYGLELTYSFKEGQLSNVSAVGQYTNTKLDHLYKAKVNMFSAISLLWRFKTALIGENATHSIGLYSSSIIQKHPIRLGFQSQFNI